MEKCEYYPVLSDNGNVVRRCDMKYVFYYESKGDKFCPHCGKEIILIKNKR
jgi:hypothetical protein